MTNKGKQITCYWGSGSAPSWRVLICIHEKELTDATLTCLSMSAKEHKSTDILAINPRGQLPTFKDGDIVINESIAICHYLAERYKGQGTELIPENKIDAAKNLQRMNEIQNLYGNVINLARYYWKRKPYYTDEVVQEKINNVNNELILWDTYLKSGNLAGHNFSLADACLFPVIAFMNRLGADLTKFNNINSFYIKLCNRDSIKKTWPPHWKESKNKTVFKNLIR